MNIHSRLPTIGSCVKEEEWALGTVRSVCNRDAKHGSKIGTKIEPSSYGMVAQLEGGGFFQH